MKKEKKSKLKNMLLSVLAVDTQTLEPMYGVRSPLPSMIAKSSIILIPIVFILGLITHFKMKDKKKKKVVYIVLGVVFVILLAILILYKDYIIGDIIGYEVC